MTAIAILVLAGPATAAVAHPTATASQLAAARGNGLTLVYDDIRDRWFYTREECESALYESRYDDRYTCEYQGRYFYPIPFSQTYGRRGESYGGYGGRGGAPGYGPYGGSGGAGGAGIAGGVGGRGGRGGDSD
jgi:hypothetical protein